MSSLFDASRQRPFLKMSHVEVGAMTGAKASGLSRNIGRSPWMRVRQRTSRNRTRQSRQAGNSAPFPGGAVATVEKTSVPHAPRLSLHITPERVTRPEGPGVPRTRKKTGQWRVGSWHRPQPCARRTAPPRPTRAECALGSEGNDLGICRRQAGSRPARTCKSGEGIRYGYLSGERLSVWERIIAPSIRPAR